MKKTTVLIYREWLQLLRYGCVRLQRDRLIALPASEVNLLDLLGQTPEIDYRDKTALIGCELDIELANESVEVTIDDVIRWFPLSVSTSKDLRPEADRLKCELDKCPWQNEFDRYVERHHIDRMQGVLRRWLSSFQLVGDVTKANSACVDLPRIRDITFPGKPFSGIFFAIDGHAHTKPSNLRESVKALKNEYQSEQYQGFVGYPKQLEHLNLLIKSKDQGFSLLALALLYTYTSLEKGLLDFCTFHNDVIWLSEQTSAQEALNVASIVGRHHGPEYMTGVYYSSSSNAAFVQDQEVTAYLATFQEDVAKRKQQSTAEEGEQNDGDAIAPEVDQAPDSSVEESHDNTDVNAQGVAKNDQADGNAPRNDSSDAVASGDVSEPTDEQPEDKSPVQSDQPDSDVASESESSGTAVDATEPEIITETDAQAPLGANHSAQVTNEANEGTETADGGDVAKSESKPEVNPDAATSDSATEDEDKSASGDSSADSEHNDASSLQSGEKPVVGIEHKEQDPPVAEQVTDGEKTIASGTSQLTLVSTADAVAEGPNSNSVGNSADKSVDSSDSKPRRPKRTAKPTSPENPEAITKKMDFN